MILTLKQVGTNSLIRFSLDKLICYEPSQSNPQLTLIHLENDIRFVVAIHPEELDKRLIASIAIKDEHGHLIRSI